MIDNPTRTSALDLDSVKKAALIPLAGRIFVNRNLRMSGLEAIGFDMDHTLAVYDPGPFEELAFDQTKAKLLAAGYPPELASVRYDAAFVIRGLVIDKKRGNILKMDQHRYVARAYHGMRPVPDERRKRLYQRKPIHLSGDDYATIDTPFSLPEIDLYGQIVELADRRSWRPRDYGKIYDDVRRAADEAHADGSIKNRIASDPDRFLLRDPALPATLHRMKEHGYRLFLLTNSEAAYTSLIMDHLLSGQIAQRRAWTEFFDLIVVRAGKPGFFRNRSAAREAVLPGVGSPQEAAKAVTGGGVWELERRLGCQGDRILYFGDHTYGDILKSKRVRLWRTAMVVQELEKEIITMERLSGLLTELRERLSQRDALDLVRDHFQGVLQESVPPKAPHLTRRAVAQLLESVTREIESVEARIQQLEDTYESEHNLHWGPLFRTGLELSHFAAQLRDFACIYTSRVSNFLHYPMDKYFQAHAERMPHEI